MLFRDRIVARLAEDLIGPLTDDEVLADRPTQRYSTGILYPIDTPFEPDEDNDSGGLLNETEDSASDVDDPAVSLHAALKPASAGLSFAMDPEGDAPPVIHVRVTCAMYEQFGVDEAGDEIEGPPANRKKERWRRLPLVVEHDVAASEPEIRLDLGKHGIRGMELYGLISQRQGIVTITLALANRRARGDSAAFDEEQHFFQVGLSVSPVRGRLVPRPSGRGTQDDDDARSAALIYRHVREYAVGHTCSARAIIEAGAVVAVRTEWLPTAIVHRVSDRGDPVFHSLDQPGADRPVLNASWLSSASPSDLSTALGELVVAYGHGSAGRRPPFQRFRLVFKRRRAGTWIGARQGRTECGRGWRASAATHR